MKTLLSVASYRLRVGGAAVLAAVAMGATARAGGLPIPSDYNTTPVSLDLVSTKTPLYGPWDVPPDPNNIEEYGQCTYWAAEKRPDIAYEAEYVYGYPQYHGAFDWEVDAAAAGYPIDHTPRVGDLAASPPGYTFTSSDGTTWTAGSVGHLTYVEQVNSDGSFVVSEMNAGWPLHGDIALLPAAAAAGMSFIHQLHPSFFTGEESLGAGVYYLTFPNGNYLGYYSYLTDSSYLYHFDLGYEYVSDAGDGNRGIYLYDFTSGDFFYTSPGFAFPYLYDFGLESVVYYYPDPNNAGHYNTDGVRYFFVFNTGQIISK